jgi:hypothetical protein
MRDARGDIADAAFEIGRKLHDGFAALFRALGGVRLRLLQVANMIEIVAENDQ